MADTPNKALERIKKMLQMCLHLIEFNLESL